MVKIRPPEHYSNVKDVPVDMEGAENCTIRWLLHKGKGAKNFAMRVFTLGDGGHTPYHTHDFEHEVFCLEGNGAINFEGTEHEFKPGYYALVPGGIMHNFINKGPGEFKFMCLIPGEAGRE